MAANKTLYLDYTGLQQYDDLLKQYIIGLNTKSFKAVAIDGYTLKFYKVENPTEADAYFPITLPKQDLSNLLNKITDGVVGNVVTIGEGGIVVDSGIKSEDLATKANVKDVSDKLGSLDALKTTAKTTAVDAINEVKDALDQAESDHKVALSIKTDPEEGILKSYTITQGEGENAVTVGKIDIPKDLVVTEGSVVENPEGQPEGTYIKLVIANQTAPLYINVKDLVDVYTAAQNAAQVQLAINSNEISATIVAGSIGTTELADNSVTTAKIGDGQITRAKISTEFEKAIKDLENAVGEGGSVATQITNAINALDATVTSAEVESGKGLQATVVETDGKLTSVTLIGNYDNKYDTLGSANTALTDAKKYTDDKDTAMDIRVDSLEEKVGDGFGSISEAEISALFPQE